MTILKNRGHLDDFFKKASSCAKLGVCPSRNSYMFSLFFSSWKINSSLLLSSCSLSAIGAEPHPRLGHRTPAAGPPPGVCSCQGRAGESPGGQPEPGRTFISYLFSATLSLSDDHKSRLDSCGLNCVLAFNCNNQCDANGFCWSCQPRCMMNDSAVSSESSQTLQTSSLWWAAARSRH